jgi:hypothetical protein
MVMKGERARKTRYGWRGDVRFKPTFVKIEPGLTSLATNYNLQHQRSKDAHESAHGTLQQHLAPKNTRKQ